MSERFQKLKEDIVSSLDKKCDFVQLMNELSEHEGEYAVLKALSELVKEGSIDFIVC